MLFLRVLSTDASRSLLPDKRGFTTVGPSSLTRLGWFRLTPIDQYSSLLPPVGVWSVSQYQCGPSSQNPYASSPCAVTRQPANAAHAIRHRCYLCFSGSPERRYAVLDGISFRLSPVTAVPYVLLTRAPVAGRSIATPRCPRLACVRPVASVHPEPGSNSSLLFISFFFFLISKKSKDTNRFVPFCCSALTETASS